MKLSRIALATLFATLSTSAFAADIKTSGFFNGVMIVDEDGNYDFGKRTSAGIQFDAQFNDKFSGTLQAVNRENAWNKTTGRETTIEYGFLAYKASDNLTVRAGKLRLPFFMLSEYVEVGSVVPWNHAPEAVYKQLPTNAYEGIDVLYTGMTGDISYSIQAFTGSAEAPVTAGSLNSNVKLDNAFGGNLTLGYGDWNVRLSYGQADASFKLNTVTKLGIQQGISDLTAGAQQAADAALALAAIDPAQAAQYQAQANALSDQAGQYVWLVGAMENSEKMAILNIGVQGYITDQVSVMAEYVDVSSDHPIEGDDSGFYLSTTYELDNGIRLTGMYSEREENAINLSGAERRNSEQMSINAAYTFENGWTTKAELHNHKGQISDYGTTVDVDENTFTLSANYVF